MVRQERKVPRAFIFVVPAHIKHYNRQTMVNRTGRVNKKPNALT